MLYFFEMALSDVPAFLSSAIMAFAMAAFVQCFFMWLIGPHFAHLLETINLFLISKLKRKKSRKGKVSFD